MSDAFRAAGMRAAFAGSASEWESGPWSTRALFSYTEPSGSAARRAPLPLELGPSGGLVYALPAGARPARSRPVDWRGRLPRARPPARRAVDMPARPGPGPRFAAASSEQRIRRRLPALRLRRAAPAPNFRDPGGRGPDARIDSRAATPIRGLVRGPRGQEGEKPLLQGDSQLPPPDALLARGPGLPRPGVRPAMA